MPDYSYILIVSTGRGNACATPGILLFLKQLARAVGATQMQRCSAPATRASKIRDSL